MPQLIVPGEGAECGSATIRVWTGSEARPHYRGPDNEASHVVPACAFHRNPAKLWMFGSRVESNVRIQLQSIRMSSMGRASVIAVRQADRAEGCGFESRIR